MTEVCKDKNILMLRVQSPMYRSSNRIIVMSHRHRSAIPYIARDRTADQQYHIAQTRVFAANNGNPALRSKTAVSINAIDQSPSATSVLLPGLIPRASGLIETQTRRSGFSQPSPTCTARCRFESRHSACVQFSRSNLISRNPCRSVRCGASLRRASQRTLLAGSLSS